MPSLITFHRAAAATRSRQAAAVLAGAALSAVAADVRAQATFRVLDFQPSAVSADGSVVVGESYRPDATPSVQAIRWTPAEGAVGLGVPAGAPGTTATDLSADGSVMVGNASYGGRCGSESQAFRWTQSTGAVLLSDVTAVITVVPEPGAVGLAAAAGAVGFLRRRRENK
jgi:hypothetical protein